MTDNPYPLYLSDVADTLIREARRAVADASDPPQTGTTGSLLHLASALDWKQHAVAFGLLMADLGPLAEVDPERDPLPRRPPD